MRRLGVPFAAIVLLAASPAPQAGPEAHAHWAVATDDAKAQDLFDRGLAMLYAFDAGEARVAFAAAAQRDPDLAMAYWGQAEADTIDINEPSTREGEVRGRHAVAEGRAHLAHASPEVRALLEAIAKRYGKGSLKERYASYADAMSAYSKAHRDDPNVLTVSAFAIWNAEDVLLDRRGASTPKAGEMLDDLDRALVLEPANLGAHHLRIHLLEMLRRAKDAVPDAEALDSYSYPPGESHLPHMAGHIWARVGEYDRLIDDNERAVENDRAWFALGNGPGQQYMKLYHDHDLDFVAYGLTTEGRNDEARAAVATEDARMQMRVALRLHEYARVRGIEPGKGGDVAFMHAIAAARSGDAEGAKTEAARARKEGYADDVFLTGVLAQAQGQTETALRDLERAYDDNKTRLGGDPKTSWELPIGENYAVALLSAGKAAPAESVFAAELMRYPNDPRLEWGLAEARKAQGKDDAAARAAYRAHWKGTRDLTLADLG